jgi:hypothetical protein
MDGLIYRCFVEGGAGKVCADKAGNFGLRFKVLGYVSVEDRVCGAGMLGDSAGQGCLHVEYWHLPSHLSVVGHGLSLALLTPLQR